MGEVVDTHSFLTSKREENEKNPADCITNVNDSGAWCQLACLSLFQSPMHMHSSCDRDAWPSRQRGTIGRFPLRRACKLKPDPCQLETFLGRKRLGGGDDRGSLFKLGNVLQSDHGDGDAGNRQ